MRRYLLLRIPGTGIITVLTFVFYVTGFCLMLPLPEAEAENLLQVYARAVENDPVFQRAHYENMAAREVLKQAYSGFLPTLSVNAESGRNRQNVIDSDIVFYSPGARTYPTNRYSITVNQPLFSPVSLVILSQAKTELKRADIELERMKQELILRVSSTYFKVLAAQDQLAFARSEYTAVQKHYEVAQLQHNRGLAPITDLYDARARLAMVEVRIIEMQDEWDDVLQTLRELIDVFIVQLKGVGKELELIKPDPDNIDSWIQAALDHNLELLAQNKAVDIAEQEIERFKSERYPGLDIVGGGYKEKNDGSLFGGGSDIESGYVILRMSMHLYQGGMLNSRVREATHRYRSALKNKEQLARAVEREVRAAFYGVSRAIGRVEALRQAVMAQELSLEAKEEGFSAGTFTSIDVLDAERDLYQARQDYSRARYDYIVNSLRLKLAVGQLSDNDIAIVNKWLE